MRTFIFATRGAQGIAIVFHIIKKHMSTFNKYAWLKDVGRTDVSKEALCCAAILYNYADAKTAKSVPSYARLANEAKLSREGVKKALQELMFSGLLRVERANKGQNEYFLLMASGWKERTAKGYQFERTTTSQRGRKRSVGQTTGESVGQTQPVCGADSERSVGQTQSYKEHIFDRLKSRSNENLQEEFFERGLIPDAQNSLDPKNESPPWPPQIRGRGIEHDVNDMLRAMANAAHIS